MTARWAAALFVLACGCKGGGERSVTPPPERPDAAQVVRPDAAPLTVVKPELPPGPPIALARTQIRTAAAATDDSVLVHVDGTVEAGGRRYQVTDRWAVEMVGAVKTHQVDLRVDTATAFRHVAAALELVRRSGHPRTGLVVLAASGVEVSLPHPLGVPAPPPGVFVRPEVADEELERLRGCYVELLVANPRLEGAVDATLTLDDTGWVTAQRARNGEPGLEDCVERFAHRWRFDPTVGRSLDVRVWFDAGAPPPCEPPAALPLTRDTPADLDGFALELTRRCPNDVGLVAVARDVPFGRVADALVALIDDPDPGARRLRGYVLSLAP